MIQKDNIVPTKVNSLGNENTMQTAEIGDGL